MNRLAQLQKIDTGFTVSFSNGEEELWVLEDFSDWEEVEESINEILDRAEKEEGKRPDYKLALEDSYLGGYLEDNEVKDIVFEVLETDNPLVIYEFAIQEGVGLESALNEAAGSLAGTCMREIAAKQLANNLGITVEVLQEKIGIYIDWEHVEKDLSSDYIEGEHYVFRA